LTTAANDDAGSHDGKDVAIASLLVHLQGASYRFVATNRSSHSVVRQRRDAEARHLLRDAFGWLRPFRAGILPGELEAALLSDGLISQGRNDWLVSRIRVSSVGDLLFAHSPPGANRSAVFLGPDSYRYARFLRQTLAGSPAAGRALDIGVGAGVGALTLLRAGLATDVTGSDVNPHALRLARLNAEHAGLPLKTTQCSGLPSGAHPYDLIVANPPFIAGQDGAIYRDGGALHGAALSLEWARASLARLAEGGRFLLYTGAPVVDGTDLVREALEEMTKREGLLLDYDEIDPDIFGSSLKLEAYRDVERIAAVGAVVTAC
jgi:hypothetical protein